MTLRRSWVRPAVAAAMVAMALAGCAGKKKATLAYEERPVELLYAAGADRLDRRQWNSAVSYFQEVERQHPYSEWSRRAILMQAYAHYESNDYTEAVADADRFISLYPGNPAAAYAYYIKAICYFEQIVDTGRDQAATGQALDALRNVVQRFPNTEYAQDARLKIDMVNDQLAGKEMDVGRWYLRQGDTLAAIGRFRTVVDRYQTTTHTPEALYRLVEAYLTLGLIDEARRNGAVLGYNYPGDPWYSEAYKLLTSKGLRPATAPKEGVGGMLRIPFFNKDKSKTLAPPKNELPPTAVLTPRKEDPAADAAPADEAAATPAPTESAPAAEPEKKRRWLRVPFLGKKND